MIEKINKEENILKQYTVLDAFLRDDLSYLDKLEILSLQKKENKIKIYYIIY